MSGETKRFRWVTEREAQRTGQSPSAPRAIEIWCEEESHPAVHIATLRSRRGPALTERWRPKGEHVEEEQLILRGQRDVRPEALEALGMVAERYRFRCPDCGLDVVAGDRLGNPGFRSVWERRDDMQVLDKPAMDRAMRTENALSDLADAGVSRLSLVSLGRILSM